MSETRVMRALQHERAVKGLSLRAMAVKLGVSAAYLSDLENGRRRLSLAMAFRLARHTTRNERVWQLHQVDDDREALNRKRKELADAHP